ncbi:MAG: hypothetical protein P4K80_06025 [Acidobacteriaceae bacterium]|nr:hypothetical protein [Acidobacteriaceae bacterium]
MTGNGKSNGKGNGNGNGNGNSNDKSSSLWRDLYSSHPSLMKPRWMGHPATAKADSSATLRNDKQKAAE